MFCPQCGATNPDNAVTCQSCGKSVVNPYQSSGFPQGGFGAEEYPERRRRRERVPNYLVQAILCTLFCCIPFGIVAIVYAAQVDGKAAAGDHHGALAASNSAKTWCWVSFGIGMAVVLVYLVGGIASVAVGPR